MMLLSVSVEWMIICMPMLICGSLQYTVVWSLLEFVGLVGTFVSSPVVVVASVFFFFFIFTLYSPRHLTYRGSGRAIPLHALQTTVKVFYWLIVSLAHPFHAPFMQFQNQKLF